MTLRIKESKIELVLEEDCWRCDGTGYAEGTCPICEGKKVLLTDTGKQILKFVKRHLSEGE